MAYRFLQFKMAKLFERNCNSPNRSSFPKLLKLDRWLHWKKKPRFADCCRKTFQGAEVTGAIVASVSHFRPRDMILLQV
jgi:hypothetical protein